MCASFLSLLLSGLPACEIAACVVTLGQRSSSGSPRHAERPACGCFVCFQESRVQHTAHITPESVFFPNITPRGM
jgi:hypothetical protein